MAHIRLVQILLVLVSSLVSLFAVGAARWVGQVLPPDENLILYATRLDDRFSINLTDADVTKHVTIDHVQAGEGDAGWSRQGRYVHILDSAAEELRLFDMQNHELQLVTDRYPIDECQASVHWSPSDRYLAYTTTLQPGSGNGFSLNMLDLQSGQTQMIMDTGFFYSDFLYWSSDERYVAVTGGLVWDILQRQVVATFRSAIYTSLQWSPDSYYLAYVSGIPNDLDVYIMNVRQDSVMNIGLPDADDALPIWSPDGRYLAFRSRRDQVTQWMIWDSVEGHAIDEISGTVPAPPFWLSDGRNPSDKHENAIQQLVSRNPGAIFLGWQGQTSNQSLVTCGVDGVD